ncbi:MAG: hypothetical protein ACE5KY_07535, partial [Candidatus Tectimicrobiota bacterium]
SFSHKEPFSDRFFSKRATIPNDVGHRLAFRLHHPVGPWLTQDLMIVVILGFSRRLQPWHPGRPRPDGTIALLLNM